MGFIAHFLVLLQHPTRGESWLKSEASKEARLYQGLENISSKHFRCYRKFLDRIEPIIEVVCSSKRLLHNA